MMKRKVLVTGGSGFIGAEVCRALVERGYEVVGVSRRGRPEVAGEWLARVTWVAADVFEPSLWRAHLDGCGAVVHSIGIVREKPDAGVTFARLNGDSAILVAEEAAKAGVEAFVFVSALVKPPIIAEVYLTHKRRAEEALAQHPFRPIILRPGLVYGPQRPAARVLGRALELAQSLPGIDDSLRPLTAELLAQAVVNALEQPEVRGVLDIEGLERAAVGTIS